MKKHSKAPKANALKKAALLGALAGKASVAAPAAAMGAPPGMPPMGMKKGGSFRSSADGIAKRGKTDVKYLAKGGSFRSSADGIAKRGRTRMSMGGKCG